MHIRALPLGQCHCPTLGVRELKDDRAQVDHKQMIVLKGVIFKRVASMAGVLTPALAASLVPRNAFPSLRWQGA